MENPALDDDDEHLLYCTPEADCYHILPSEFLPSFTVPSSQKVFHSCCNNIFVNRAVHQSTEGTYSGKWGTENFISTVAVEIYEQGDFARVVLLLPSKEVFAEVMVSTPFEQRIEAASPAHTRCAVVKQLALPSQECLDSSRYMVLTIEDKAHPGQNPPCHQAGPSKHAYSLCREKRGDWDGVPCPRGGF